MTPLHHFPITKKWPAKNPEIIQLYSLPTPNGVKISIALEELELPYEAHRVDFSTEDQFTPEFLSLNPNNKIPAILDPNGPNGPMGLWESGAILLYLAEKTGKLLPKDPQARYETLQWLFFQIGGVGPMFGQFGHFFKFAADQCDHPYPVERYKSETKRLLTVLENRLEHRQTLMGDEYTIADIALFPWVNGLRMYDPEEKAITLSDWPHVEAWLEACLKRPASQKGLTIPAKPDH